MLNRLIVSLIFLYPMAFPKDKDVRMVCEIPTSSEIQHINPAQFRDLLLRFGNCTAIALHRHWSPHGGYVTLINATPYDWNLTSVDQNQMEYDFPGLIPAGTAHEQYINFINDHADGTAEALYTLVDAPSAASFSVQARHMGDKQVSIQYHDTLSSVNNQRGSKIDLGFQKDGGVSFILSGSGPSFVSSNPPTGWMQKSLPSIGSKYLREIAMPASHNSGMSKLNYHYGGVDHNTLTQSLGVYNQAENGARYFDIRPVLRKGKFYAGHFSKLMGKHVGGIGSAMLDIVHDINGFNNAFPGELLILDISHDMNVDRDFRHFTEQEWQELYRILDEIADLWAPGAYWSRDLSAVPLSTFITPGSRSATVVRLPSHAPLPLSREEHSAVEVDSAEEGRKSEGNGDRHVEGNGKGENKGKGEENGKIKDFGLPINQVTPPSITGILHDTAFVPDAWLPVTNRYANTNRPDQMSADQIRKMRDHNPSEDGMLMGVWTLTEHWHHSLDVANHKHSIIGDAAQAHRRLFSDLWPEMSKERYPNLIQIDDIHNKDVLALAMAINNNFASPFQLSRRDISAGETSQPPASKSGQECSRFDRWAHWWNFYPENECYSPHPFQSLAKNAQELAREWRDNERAKAHAKANDTLAMQKDEEEWQSRRLAAKAKATWDIRSQSYRHRDYG